MTPRQLTPGSLNTLSLGLCEPIHPTAASAYLQNLHDAITEQHDLGRAYTKNLLVVRGCWESTNDRGRAWIVMTLPELSEGKVARWILTLRVFLFKLQAQGSVRTPSYRTTPDEPREKAAKSRATSFKSDVLQRDGPKCQATGKVLANKVDEFARVSGLVAPDATDEADGEICHLIPWSLGEEGGGPIVSFFEALTGCEISSFCATSIDSPQNGLVLDCGVHNRQRLFEMTFKPTAEANQYELIWDKISKNKPYQKYTSRVVTFKSTPTILPPSPIIMNALHCIYKITHASAAAEEILLPSFRLDLDTLSNTFSKELKEKGEDEQDGHLNETLAYLDLQLKGLLV